MIRKELLLEGSEFFLVHLKIINPLLPIELTRMEILVTSKILYFNATESLVVKYKKNYRKYVRNMLNLSSSSLYNYIKELLRKGALVDSDTGEVNQLLIPENTEEYYFRLKRNF